MKNIYLNGSNKNFAPTELKGNVFIECYKNIAPTELFTGNILLGKTALGVAPLPRWHKFAICSLPIRANDCCCKAREGLKKQRQQGNFEDLPLLSAADIKNWFGFKRYKEMTEEQFFDQMYQRHRIRQQDINNSYQSF